MDPIIGETNLSEEWRNAVIEDRFAKVFPAPEDDATGRWNDGTLIKVGLGVTDSGFGFQATNTETGEVFNLGLHRKELGDGFVLTYNEARGLKPGGKSLPKVGRQPSISPEAKDCRFNCTRPNLAHSIYNHVLMVRVSELGLNWDWHVYANAFPGEPRGQFLWLAVQTVGGRLDIPHLPQRWDRSRLEDFLTLMDMSQGMIFLWMAYPGGGASVLHFHFHSFALDAPRAIERAVAGRKLKGYSCHLIENYPARGLVWGPGVSAEELYLCDSRFTDAGYPPNLIHVGGRTFMFPRDPEHEITEVYPSGLDPTGNIPVPNREVWQNTTLTQLQAAFKEATLDPETIVEILST